ASHSAVWNDVALAVAGESATATTNRIRSLRIVAPPKRDPTASTRSRRSAYRGPLAIAHRDACARSRHGFGRATLSAAPPSPKGRIERFHQLAPSRPWPSAVDRALRGKCRDRGCTRGSRIRSGDGGKELLTEL